MFPRIAPFAGVFFCVLVLFSSPLEAQCQPNEDCNQNGVADQCDIDLGSSDDCNGNQIPDECDLELLTSEDCNLDGIPDECSPSIRELVGIGLSFGDGFGSSVDSSPQYAVVGAPDDDLLGTNTGSANIFKRTGTQWIEEMKIFGISASLEDHFGAAVAVEGDLVAIGAPGKMQGRGAVFLYRRVGNGWWNYEGTLTAFDAPLGAAFGSALAIENEMIVVGAPGTVNGLGSGAVYLFSRESGMWLQEQKLESDTLTDGDMLGSSIAIHEGSIVTGAPGYDAGGMTNSGLVIIFEESAGTWTESLSISATNPSPFASFGFSIDVDQDRLLVGAPGENVETGAAYLHTRLANMWIDQVKMEPLVPEEGGLFGADVGLDVKTLVISAPAAGSDQGQVVIYRQQGADWIREEPMTQIVDRQPGEQFGSSITCQLPFLLVGSSGQNSGDSLWISVYNDCNSNLEDDICDVTQGLEPDCNFNLVPDSCEISDGTKQDCDGNGIPDECQISTGELPDCNMNGIPDACDISSGFSLDCNVDGNPDECQTGADPNPPSISNMPGPFSVSTDQGICGAVLTWDEPVATDDCGVASLESSHASGSLFSTGLTVVSYTATDVSGNVRTAMFTVVVTDNELPTLSDFQAEVIAEAGQGVCELAVSWPNPTPQDNCAVFSSSVSHQPGTLFPIGTTVVAFTLMDSNGNMSTLNMNVIVLDTSAPEIVDLPADVQSGTDLGSCNKIVEWIDPTSTDDCTVESFTSTHQSGDTFDLGTTVVTYTVVDAGGNSVNQSFNVTITDQELPTFTAAPANISTGNDPGDCGAVITWAPAVVDDNCGIASTTSSHQPGDHFDLGDTEVSITTTDVNGNVSTHIFTVTILDTEAPELSNIPQNVVLNNDPAECTAVYNWALPQISDNCGISTFEGSSNSGESFPLGTTTVEYLLVDTSGNQSTGSFDITVNDTEMPILLGMPQDIAVFNDSGQCGANVSWIVPTPWDNCNLVDFDASHEPGAFFPKGVTEVSYLVMDGMGQVTSGTFTISVDDDEAPTITGMPADRTIVADAGLCSAIHEWVLPIGQDNCEVVSFTASHDPGDTFPVGVTEIGYSVTDSMGMTTTDQFSLTVLDQEDPVIIRIPGDISVVADEGECSMPVSWVAPDSQDNCAIDTFSISHMSGSVFETGVTTVSIDTQDIHGNTAVASFQVTVLDQETPQILSLPAAIQLESDADQCGTLVTWVEPLGSDNCQVALLSTTSENGGFYPVGSSTVTYMIEDASGNSDEASFNITITDTTNPQFMQIPNGISVPSDQGDCGAIVTWLEVTASDNCAVESITGTHASGDFFNKGLTVVEHTVTDIHGNQTTQSFDINVTDNELPVIMGIDQNLTIENDLGQCGANVTWQEPTASDNCEVTSLTVNIPSGAFFSEGTTLVTYTTSDDSGNENTKSFNVTVQDLELPSFTSIPESVVAETTTNSCSGIATWDTVTGADNCLVDSIVSSHASGDEFPLGNTQVSVSITDIHGNMREQEFSVLIEDTELPSFVDMPEDIFQTTEVGLCGAVIDWTEPSAADNCLVNELIGSHVPNTFFERGITVVTYTVTDASGNEYLESFQINVVDLEVPQLSAPPADIQAIADAGSCGTTISWIEPTATDNCSVQSVISSHDPEDFFATGTTIVSYTAQDPTGNISTVQFLVTILDEEMPTINNMPVSLVVDNDQGDCGAIVSWDEPTILDNCGIAVSGADHLSGSFFAVGSTLVTYVAEDVSGNQVNAEFTVTVEDNQAPQFQGSISNAILDTDAGECGAVHSWVAPEVSENCAGLQVTTTHEPGSFFTPGLNIVTYTASDAAGNTTSLMFTVVVQDNENPVIAGTPESMDLGTDLDSCGRVVNWQQPSASDNCAILSYSSTHNSGDFFPVGTTTVIFTATDTVGHSTSTQFEIVVSDNQAPSITQMPQDVVINSQLGICGSVHAWDLPLSSDNCPDHVFSGTHLPGDEFPVGTSTVSYTAIDAAGNVTSEAFSITVVDIENPEITGLPQNIDVSTDPDQCNAFISWLEPTSTDNCSVASFTSTHSSGSIFETGTTLVTYTAEDSAGHVTTGSFEVTVTDTQAPAYSSSPENALIENTLGSCGANHSWEEPTILENCPDMVVTSSHASGDFFEVGTTTVEYTATDSSGNITLTAFDVVVEDSEFPLITQMPESITSTNDLDSCGAVINWIDPLSSDNCSLLELVSSHVNGDIFPIGLTTVTYTATDTAGNVSTSSFDITVADTQAPQISQTPLDVVIDSQAGICGSVFEWTSPSITDNCLGTNVHESHSSGTEFPLGTTEISYTAIDATGNVTQSFFSVTVVDIENPMISDLPENISVGTDPDQCSAIVEWAEPTFTDNCQVSNVSVDIPSGSIFDLGTTTVTYMITDSSGLQSTANFDVTVEDIQVPILENMPSNVVLINEPGSCEKIYTWNEPIAVDNCPNVEMTSSHQSGESFPVGLTIVEYQASDANGLSRQVFFTVVVMDMEDPVISGIPESVIIENDQDACGAIHSWIDPAASDNCATIGFSTNHANGSFFDLGTTTVTYTVSDPSGNTVSSSFDVTVVDLQVPEFVTMPANASINTDPGVCGATHTWDIPQINDNCDSVNLASSHQPGDMFPIGDTVVNYTAQDLTGNVISDSFTVTVTDFEDPDFEGIPATIVASTDSGQCDAVISWVPPVPVDNCEVASHSISHQPGDTFALGETTVLLSAFDIYGNEFNTSFKVVVEDLELPVISGTPESVTLQSIPGFCGSTHDWVSPTATDNCDTLTVISSHSSGSMFPTGTTTVDFEVVDLSGNSSVSSFEIVVEDIEAPEFTTIPTDFTVSADVDQCGTVVTWAEATGTDNCEVSSIEYDRANGEYLGLGEYPVNATITDIHGNTATQQFVITVVDDTPPVITNMPTDILLFADDGQCGSVATWSEPASTDNCSGELLANNIISGSFFIVGDTQVAYVATDVSGNTTTEIFTVTVLDNQAPTFENIPADITVSNDPGICGAHVSWAVESALDNCGIQSHVSSMNPGDLFPNGTTTVQINATDNSGNSVSGSFQVTVEDTEAPEIVNLPNDLVVDSDQGLCGAIVSWVEPFAVDNCEMATLTSSLQSGTYLTTGVHSVTYSASDVYGNVRDETFSIEVLDSEAPVISSGPGSVELTTEPGQCGASFSWSELQVTDNCSVVEITRSHENGAFFQKGTTLVTLTATDAAGGSIQHEFEVSVSDNESPQFGSTLGGVSLTTSPGECGSLAFWAEPEFSDNCEISTVVKSHESGDFFQLGETLVTYTLTDGSGNSSSIDFMVQISDTELPVISGLQSGISVVNDIGSCGAAVFWDSPVVTDNCSIASVESTHQSGDYFPVGSTVVTYSVADASDLTSSFEFVVVVEDTEAPVLLGVPSQQTLQTDQGMCGSNVSWSSPMASDNCQVASLTSDVENGTFLNTGNHTINFEAVDIHGNVSQASFSVIILDEEAPQILGLPTLVEGVNDSGSCQGSVTWTEPTISDNCSDFVVSTSHQNGGLFPIGTTTVTYTVDDLSGNQTSVAFEVSISDIHGPEITGLPLGISTDTDPGSCIAVVTWPEAVIADLCDTHVVSQSHLSGAEFPIGLTMVSYVATDAAGNVTEVTFPITVTDNEAPQITFIPDNQVLIANEDECSMIANWDVPTAVDNCGIASITTSALSGDQYSIGVNTVAILVIDVNGNESNAAFQITVVDNESPIITGAPADISVVSDPTICGAEITWVEPSVIENCDLLAFESDHVPGEVFPVGLTIVTYVATDFSGNSISASFTVTVIDEESPTIEIPVPVIVEAPEGTCEAFVEVPQLDVFDRCGVAQISNSFNGTSDASGIYPKGETLILWSVSDASGNTSTIMGVVSVLVTGPDCNNNGIPDICDLTEGTSLDCNLDGVPDDCQADCDDDGILDVCEIEQGLSLDCNGDAVPDSCQIESGIEADCDNDGLIDSCEIITGSGIDCDSSGVLDSCEILAGTAADCNGNGQPDACDIAIGVESDCNLDGIADDCQIASGSETDCNANGVIDSCELASGTSSDCNANGTLDECDLAGGTSSDCNENDIPDSCDISSGVAFDCNSNGQLDSCDIVQGLVEDCDTNNVPDSCDVSTGAVPDCNGNGIPDSCDLSSGSSEDCDSSGIPDSCEVASGAVTDCNVNGVPDACDLATGAADCNSDEVLDSCQVVSGEVPDCNSNGIPDGCDIASGTANDCDDNGVLDTCEVGNGQAADCNQNGIPDSCDITSGLESDCNESGVPDSCEVLSGTTLDCNDNGIPDSCDIASGDWQDCDDDGNLDSCEILVGTEEDCNGTGVPDSCEVLSGVAQDCNGNMVPDSCDLNNGTLFDCDLNGTPDSCDVAAGGVEDCNGNMIPDSCDLESGALSDCNQNDIPDFCEITNGSTEDCNTNLIPDSCEIAAGTLEDVDLDGVPDSCQLNFLRGDGNGDGIVNIADGIFLLQSLFSNSGNSNCMDAADANDDGSVDVSDVISILGYQFNGTNPPPAPYPNCGVDPAGGTSLGCISYTSCP
jgi:hypothetical protein